MHTGCISRRTHLLLISLLFLFSGIPDITKQTSCHAGETEVAQPYEHVRYPTFANGRIQSLLEADQAEAYDLASGTPRINLKNVIITIYDHADEFLKGLPENQSPPVKMIITSDRGYFTRRPPEPNAMPEEIANLEGNVILHHMRAPNSPPPKTTKPSRLPAGVETEIHCEHAQWNNTLRKLNGDGEVEFIQEDSRVTGTGFLYLADDDALDTGSSTSNIKDWGGIVFIEHNARMEIDRIAASSSMPGASGRTEITCRDTASYKLREREIQFEREVKIRRPGLVIESDILKVFLRQEDDPTPDGNPVDPNAPVPGQVKNIIATIGNRPGSVIVNGYKENPETGIEELQFSAKGGRADFDYDANRITLTDTRKQRFPEVEMGPDKDRISDNTLIFVFTQVAKQTADGQPATESNDTETVLDNLSTYGGSGEVILRSRRVDETGPMIPTFVNYAGDMDYKRADGRIRFHDNVRLRRDEMKMKAELLDIRLSSDGTSVEPNQINRILAEVDVDIDTGDYKAKSQRAEYDIYQGQVGEVGTGLDTLRLYGPPNKTPPHPWIRDPKGNQITAPEIHMQRLSTPVGVRNQHLLVGRGGTSVCDFISGETVINERPRPKVVSIKCERGMEYHQANKKARFEGKVMVTSDAPEDNYVLTSDRLIVDFEETPNSEDPDDYDTWFRRITAEGNARLIQDARICEATNIIRDFPTNDPNSGDIYLQGSTGQGDAPPVMAVLREQQGAQVGTMFIAPLIKSTSLGDLIQANGPGQLSVPDDGDGDGMQSAPGARAEIHFEGAASYEALEVGEAGIARFWGGVVCRQPSRNITVTADEMDARFIQDAKERKPGGQTTNLELEHVGRLRRIEGRKNVRIENPLPRGGRRVALGDTGAVEFTGTGNIVRLTVDRSHDAQRMVLVRDQDGMTLRSPDVEIREAQGITRASGPGDMQIPADTNGEGMSRLPTRILYGENGALVYNELALNIKVNDNVRIVQPTSNGNWNQPSLDGICDRMDISLLEPPGTEMSGDDALSRIQKMDAIGSVLLRVYADAPSDNPDMNWLQRPGTTFFTRGDQATYDVQGGVVSIFCTVANRQPELLMNVVESGSAPRRQRMKADRFVLQMNTVPRRWNFEGELDSSTIRDGEAFEFTGR